MSIGIDFILRANSSGFTQGMASVNNSIKDVKKSFREFDVGHGLKNALGVGGIIAGFSAAINGAQKTRDELEKLGKPVDDATASVARYGDSIDALKKGTLSLAVATLSFYTEAGEGMGMFINRLRGISAEQEALAEKIAKGAELQEKNLAALREKRGKEALTIDKEVAESERKSQLAAMTDEEKRNKLLEERTQLLDEIESMPVYNEFYDARVGEAGQIHNVARKQKELKANELTSQIATLGTGLNKEAEDKQAKLDSKAREELKLAQESDEKDRNAVMDKFLPTVEQLANMSAGGFAKVDDPRLLAKQVLEKEKFAAEAGGRGDIAGAMRLGAEANLLRAGLSNVTGKGTALTAETATAALKAALETTNNELVAVKEALAGVIKAQK
jgi:hypothetical protein